ncbi:hypothetical protein J2W80_001950 [Methylorubrum extorquens]|nr:hypothetical protein [Methylorubrum extorquens]MCP1590516.1 hypothetical protein [Methylorubrum extorquens]
MRRMLESAYHRRGKVRDLRARSHIACYPQVPLT